jgi:hypothetical protein
LVTHLYILYLFKKMFSVCRTTESHRIVCTFIEQVQCYEPTKELINHNDNHNIPYLLLYNIELKSFFFSIWERRKLSSHWDYIVMNKKKKYIIIVYCLWSKKKKRKLNHISIEFMFMVYVEHIIYLYKSTICWFFFFILYIFCYLC